MPDLLGVLADGAVGGEVSSGGQIQQALAAKAHPIGGVVNGAQAGIAVILEVQQQEVVVGAVPAGAVQQRGVELRLLLVCRHDAADQGVHRPADAGVGVVNAPGPVGVADGVDLFDGRAEDLVVLQPRPLDNLDIRAVHRAQGHSTVKHQLHIAGAGGLRPGGRDLLGDIRRGDNMLGVAAIIVLHEDDL